MIELETSWKSTIDLHKGFPEEYCLQFVHDMAQIRSGMVLGLGAAQELLRRGKSIDDLQSLIHEWCDDWRALEQQERELRWRTR